MMMTRELLAVVYGVKTYRQYLLGRHFVIRTDHSAHTNELCHVFN